MSDYHRLSIRDKRAAAIDSMREPPVRCPACDMACPADDLLRHQNERCPGRPPPHPRGRWIQPHEVRKLGLNPRVARRWVQKGHIRARGRGNGRQYFSRDVVSLAAQLRAGRMVRHREAKGSEGKQGELTPPQIRDPDEDMERYLTTAEVASALGLTDRRVKQMRERGEGPRFIRIGRAIRYSRNDVEAWVESQKQEVKP